MSAPFLCSMRDYSKTELCKIIDEYVLGRNAERNRQIIKRRLVDGICFEPLAEEFDISVRQCKNIVYKMQEIVFRHL